MTSATEKLRELLDERGVEWEAPKNACADLQTFFNVGRLYVTADSLWYDKERLSISMSDTLTPEQAIAATLGRETCRNEWAEFGKFRCSECWMQVGSISTNTTAPRPIKFCPNCGREVVDA